MTKEFYKKHKSAIICLIVVILLFIPAYWLGQINQERETNIVETGIETVGTVINKSIVRGRNQIRTYGVRFEFEHDGERVLSNALFHSRWYYDNAIIGMKYKVMYLPD